MKFFKSLLCSNTGSLSSKRFCGLLGWFVLMGCLGFASVSGTELPGCITEFIFGTVTLLGVDSVTSIWKDPTGSPKSRKTRAKKEDSITEEILDNVGPELKQ